MEKIVELFIEQQKENVTKLFKESEALIPMLTLLSEKDGKNCVHICPIPPIDLKDNVKDFIRFVLLKGIKEKLAENGHKLLCVNWASEAWQYSGTKEDYEKVKGNYKRLSKEEVLLLHFDTKDENKTITYKINRSLSVGDSGLKEKVNIELQELGSSSGAFQMEGRFTDLFNS